MWCYKILFGIVEIQAEDFLCQGMLQLEVTSTNHSRSPIFHAHGLTFSVNVLQMHGTVDFSSISGFKRSTHKVDISRLCKCFECVFMMCILYFVRLVYFVHFMCVFPYFLLKGHRKSLSEPGLSCSESMSVVLHYRVAQLK